MQINKAINCFLTDYFRSHYHTLIKSDSSKKSTLIPEIPLSQNLHHMEVHQHTHGLYGTSMQYNNRHNNSKVVSSAGSIYANSVLNASTRRKPSFKFDSNILNRVQTMGLENKNNNNKKSNNSSRATVNYHQVSLDSGIYLPNEMNEEHN